MYDPALLKSNQETTLLVKDIQAYVEEPEICMIAVSSSSINDQAALIAEQMNVELYTGNGISITDQLMFFHGDKPAAQVLWFDDFAHLTTCNWRFLQQLQTLVTKG